jgi:adenosylcobinamide kinase / adenosylcobinamide-phosphate guanylyltransferase
MGKLTLVTGGARSGKSTFAEKLASSFGHKVLYVATSIPFDDEMKLRIKKHREQRPSEWKTIESYRDMDRIIGESLEDRECVLLDCVTIMISNIMLDCFYDWDNIKASQIDEAEKVVRCEIGKLLHIIEVSCVPFIVVTNEVGMGIVPEYSSARAFRDFAGRANQMLAEKAQEVYLCVSGINVKIKPIFAKDV